MLARIIIDLKVFFRYPASIFFSLILPALMFIFFGTLFGSKTYGSYNFFQMYIPGYTTLIFYVIYIFVLSSIMVADRESGVFKRYSVTPVGSGYFFVTNLVKGIALSLVGLFIILLISKFKFSAVLTQHWPQFAISFLFTSLTFYSVSFLLVVLIPRTRILIPILALGFYPLFFLSGVFMPVELLSKSLQAIANYNPMYRMNMLLIGGWNGQLFSSTALRGDWIYLVTLLIVVYPLSVSLFRRTVLTK